MYVEFPVSVYGPRGWQGDMPDVGLDITEEEYDAVRRWADECGDASDYPELKRIREAVRLACIEAEEGVDRDDPNINYPGLDDCEFVLQLPGLDLPEKFQA